MCVCVCTHIRIQICVKLRMKIKFGAKVMAQQLRALTGLPEDWGLIPNTHMVAPSVCNPVAGHLMPSSGFYEASVIHIV